MMSSRIKILILVAAIIILAGGVFFLRSSRSSSIYAYSCYYEDSWDYARCVGVDDKTACYGYYDLVGTHPENGIKTTSSRGSTCEGFVDGKQIYFDEDGKFIK